MPNIVIQNINENDFEDLLTFMERRSNFIIQNIETMPMLNIKSILEEYRNVKRLIHIYTQNSKNYAGNFCNTG